MTPKLDELIIKRMKKFLIIFAAAAMLLVPAIAEAGGRHGRGNDWIGPVIFGTVLGVIIASSNHGHETVIVQERRGHRHRHHRRHRWVEICDRVPQLRQDRYGNYYTVMRHKCRMVKKARW
tara:strand:+ start:928 stop:1290 length:363 start_codon:yes stop_codon:yes gene_type:complete